MSGYASLMMPLCMARNGDVDLSAKAEFADLVERQVGSAGGGKAAVIDEFKRVTRSDNPLIAKPDLKCRYVHKKRFHVVSVGRRTKVARMILRLTVATC
ncbi:hypothetical protein [uncultured Collinsella sp.]|uniref:hypothetical protein n=1 Tax=uncultured Collinsella sp. TaxID=165190 RepID=UPI0025E6A421|nr:hypothetical protein [uncultured Collinsella sp.]